SKGMADVGCAAAAGRSRVAVAAARRAGRAVGHARQCRLTAGIAHGIDEAAVAQVSRVADPRVTNPEQAPLVEDVTFQAGILERVANLTGRTLRVVHVAVLQTHFFGGKRHAGEARAAGHRQRADLALLEARTDARLALEPLGAVHVGGAAPALSRQ